MALKRSRQTMHSKISMKSLVGLCLLVGVASAQDIITTTPPGFRGYRIFSNGATETVTCDPGNTFFASSTYAACCPVTGRCNFLSACEGGTFSRIFGGTGVCTSPYPSCMSITIYPTFPAGDQTWLYFACGLGNTVEAPYSTLYRETAAATTTSSRSLSTSTSATSSSQTISLGPVNTSPVQSTDDKDLEEGGSSSKAWIAGAVVGPLLAIAVIGLAVFFIRRRKRPDTFGDNGEMNGGVSQPYMAAHAGYQGGPGVPQHYYGAQMPAVTDWQKNGVPARTDTVSPLSGLPAYTDPKHISAQHVTEVSMNPSGASYPAELAVYPAAGGHVAELANNQRESMAELPGPVIQGNGQRQ
ncbi:hypothetical protein QBC38DRAFT_446526 [Podospora fimiseda]|uniref:Uncharacterized protein n=1 Tax=Podospora fimiseda TaxID=252190 RepID=A0AAN7BJB0_9PEZI|nr:hypothetical protein QBC38DRAFT_446526 [Podospora fimiseda]